VGHDNDYYIHGGLRKLKAYFINIYLWGGRARINHFHGCLVGFEYKKIEF
jgi:hypothetical protein